MRHMWLAPDIADALATAGFQSPHTAPWRPMPPHTDTRTYFMEFICNCGDVPKRCTMIPVDGMPRPMIAGQCSLCRVIFTCAWIARRREWTGPRHLEPARPLYSAGQGA